MDAAIIETCADPALSPAIVEQFVAAAGSENPLAITVKSDGRLVLIPRPATADQAMQVVRRYVGQSDVRVGLTQIPVGVGVDDVLQLDAAIFDSCENLRNGSGMFAKIARIVTRWYGRPTDRDVLPQMFDDAVHAWRTSYFEGENVFTAADPGGPTFLSKEGGNSQSSDPLAPASKTSSEIPPDVGMRIDLSRIQGK